MKLDALCNDCGEEVTVYLGKVVCGCNYCDGCNNLDIECACDDYDDADLDD